MGGIDPPRTGTIAAKKNNAEQFEGKSTAKYGIVNVQMEHLFQLYYDRNWGKCQLR